MTPQNHVGLWIRRDSMPERARWRGKKAPVDAIAEFPSIDLPDGSDMTSLS
jgi:hypothetical protein